MITDSLIYSENQLLKFFFTAKIVPNSYKSIHELYCGTCKIDNFINFDISEDENDIKWIENTIKNKENDNLSFVAKIYPTMINICHEISFDLEQTICKRPFEDYAKLINRNNFKDYEDDIIFHCFDEQKQDNILKKYYFHCLLYWEKYDCLSKIHNNCFIVRNALIIGTKVPCFNFCYNILKNLYQIFKRANIRNCIDIVMKKLFEEVKVKYMFNNIININLDGIYFKNHKQNNELLQKNQIQISYSIIDYIIPLDSQISLFDLNLFYFFQIFSLEDILQIYSLFRFKQNIVFISEDIAILYPIFYIIQHLFAPLCFSLDFFIYKNLSTINYDSFTHNFSSKSSKLLFVMGMKDENYHEYFKSLLQNNTSIQNVALFYIKRRKEGGYFIEKKQIYKLSLSEKEQISVENLNTIPFFHTLFGTHHKYHQQMEIEFNKFISRSQGVKYDSFYDYDWKLNEEFYSFSKKMFVCNLRVIENLFTNFTYTESIHFLFANYRTNPLKLEEHKEELEEFFIAIYLSFQHLIPSYDFLLDVFIFYYSKLYEKKHKIASDIVFTPLPDFQIKCNLNEMIIKHVFIHQKEACWNFEISNTIFQMEQKRDVSKRKELELIEQEICVFNYMYKMGLISFNLDKPTFNNMSLGLGLYCLIKGICLINGYNPYMVYNDCEFENETDFIKDDINKLFGFLVRTEGFNLFQIPIPLIILLKILLNEKITDLIQSNNGGKNYLNSFYFSLSSYIFLREDISKDLRKKYSPLKITSEHCGIINFILFDDNGHNHYNMDNIKFQENLFSLKCSLCNKKLKLKIISINKETMRRKELIITNIPSPNEIFPRVWEGICSKGLNINNCKDIEQLFNYKEWKNDYKLLFFFANFLYETKSKIVATSSKRFLDNK